MLDRGDFFMLHPLFKFIVYLFAVYGALTLVLSILAAVRGRSFISGAKVKVILVVKDAEEYIEYIVRNAVKGDFISRVMSGNNLTIIDMNSSDRTAGILNELKKEYECLDVLGEQEKDKVFSDFNSRIS